MLLSHQYDPPMILTVQEWPNNKASIMIHISQNGAVPFEGKSSGLEHGASVA